MNKRISSGNPGLDKLLDGGFLRGSVVLLAGYPGAGKTILSAKFIYDGAVKYGKPGVYACFAESKDMFLYEMENFGWDFKSLIDEKKIVVLDLSISAEIEIQSALNQIMDAVVFLHAERLVIDSITALYIGLKSDLEKRHLIRLLYKLVKRTGCTTIMIADVPWGTSRIGESIEEFIADGIILMETYYEKGMLKRCLKILKMRGINHALNSYEYNIDKREGIRIKINSS